MVRPSIALALLAAVPAFAAPAEGGVGAADPTLLSAPRGAEVRRNRFLPWHPIEIGKSLPPDTEITCEAGCSVRAPDGSVLALDPGARVAIGQTTFIRLDANGAAALGRRFDLKEGTVVANVITDKARPRTVLIGTPNDALIAIRPGEAHVSALNGHIGVACTRGGVRIKLGRTTLELKPGQASSLVADAPTARDASAAPKWDWPIGRSGEPQPLAITTQGSRGSPGIGWQPQAGASGYRVELASDAEFRHLLVTAKVSGKDHEYTAENLVEGWYYARVTAFDADGLASAPSEPRALRVIALQLPVGGFMAADGSTVVAPEGASVRLSDPGDVEMATDDRNFTPVPAQWVSDGAPHILRFRVRRDFGHETLVQMTPRPLRADVRLSPAWARWPLDPVDITVTIVDPSGRFDPLSIVPEIQVLVGIEPVTIPWKREGSTFTARLPARTLTGPEVVRVIARDRDGAMLGRNFLEVEPAHMRGRYADKALANR
jgi:hypothetical protein